MIQILLSPDSYFFNPYSLPHLLSAVFLHSLAVSILLAEKGSKISWLFTFMASVVSAWLISNSLILTSANPSTAHFWSHVRSFSICYLPVSMLIFVISVTDSYQENKQYIQLSFAASLITSVLSITTEGMVGSVRRFGWGYFQEVGYLNPTLLVYTAIAVLLSLKILWLHWDSARSQPDRKRSQIFFLAFIAISLAAIDGLPAHGFNVYPLGFVPVLGFCLILSWGIIRYRIVRISPSYAAEEMMSTMDDPLIVCDMDHTIRLVNDACQDTFGFNRDELINQSLDKLIAPSARESNSIRKLKEGELSGQEEVHFQNHNGEPIEVQTSVSRLTDSDGQPVGSVIIARDIRDQKETEQQIQKLAYQDSITNLPNRRYLFKEFSDLTESIPPKSGALLYLGLPDFNEIKHSLGPRKTEILLTKVTARFRALSGEDIELINWNEDEFVLLDLTASTPEDAYRLAEQWLETLEEPFETERRSFTLRASVGIALRSEHGSELDDLVTKADLARDRARKQSGRHIEIYEEGIQEKTSRRTSLKNDLRRAIKQEELDLVYHPILDSESEEVSHLEVLLRWHHPDEGSVHPPDTIRMAEELNMISELGDWIFRQAFEDLAFMRRKLDEDSLRISINLASNQLQLHSELLDTIDSEIQRNELAPEDLTFEITETTTMEDIEFSREVLEDIHERGCRVAVDDFGTGHSSIQYLMNLPIDLLKIDKSFILNLFDGTKNQILVETMLFMGHQLDLDIVAEGVETQHQRDFLKQHDCNYMQGFFWTEPLPRDECMDFIRRHYEEFSV